MTGHRHLDRRLRKVEAQIGSEAVEVARHDIEREIDEAIATTAELDQLREPDGLLSMSHRPAKRDAARRTAWDALRAEAVARVEWAEKGCNLIDTRFMEPDFPETWRQEMGCDLDRFSSLVREEFGRLIKGQYTGRDQWLREPTEDEIDAAMPYVLPRPTTNTRERIRELEAELVQAAWQQIAQ
jgi:hypothetical protein